MNDPSLSTGEGTSEGLNVDALVAAVDGLSCKPERVLF